MKKLLFSTFLFSLPLLSYSQAGLAFFSHERQIAVSTNFEKRFWGEFRLSTRTDNDLILNDGQWVNVRPWLLGHANIVRNSQVSLSLGLGIAPDNSSNESSPVLVLPLALRFAPFEKAKNVYILGEFAPTFGGVDFEPGLSWGVRYLFLKEQ